MDNNKPFIIEEFLESYTKKLSVLAEQNHRAPVALNENATRAEKQFFEYNVNKWSEKIANLVEPEIIPSIWQCEVVPKVCDMLKKKNCMIEDENLTVNDDGSSFYVIKIVIPEHEEAIDLKLDDQGWSTIKNSDDLSLWEGPSSLDSMQDGLELSDNLLSEFEM